MNYQIKSINLRQINMLKPLWEKLNLAHLKDSNYFKGHFEKFTFEKRCEKFNGINDDNILIEIINYEDKDEPAGYCISTVEKNVGEIDSLFVEEEHRKCKLGKKLVENSIVWFKKKNCKKIQVAVAEGHETVFGFYKKFGFYPRMTYLELKE